MSTTHSLVGYESLLERDRLWLADFDPAVSWVSSQPFWVSGRDGSVLRRHVPDFLLQTTTGFVVVDVKPAELVNDPHIAAVMAHVADSIQRIISAATVAMDALLDAAADLIDRGRPDLHHRSAGFWTAGPRGAVRPRHPFAWDGVQCFLSSRTASQASTLVAPFEWVHHGHMIGTAEGRRT